MAHGWVTVVRSVNCFEVPKVSRHNVLLDIFKSSKDTYRRPFLFDHQAQVCILR